MPDMLMQSQLFYKHNYKMIFTSNKNCLYKRSERFRNKKYIYYFYSLAGVPIVYALQKHCKKLIAEFLLKTQIYCQIMVAVLKVSLQELGFLK